MITSTLLKPILVKDGNLRSPHCCLTQSVRISGFPPKAGGNDGAATSALSSSPRRLASRKTMKRERSFEIVSKWERAASVLVFLDEYSGVALGLPI
jgi:hypothetical protein